MKQCEDCPVRYWRTVIVFRRYNNMKRGVALLGVILALLSGVEHTHLLCQLGGCAEVVAGQSCEHHDAEESATTPCSHSCKSSAPRIPAKSATEKLADSSCGLVHEDGSCPCPPDCWCNRAPQPLELPRGPSESSVAQLVTLLSGHGVASFAISVDAESLNGTNEPSTVTQTSPERCASLCRFLI